MKLDLFVILSSKSHDVKYLQTYLKYISRCVRINSSKDIKKLEKHHIIPKEKSLFPEYSSFKKYPWNLILLTEHQHVIAHLILSKVYKQSYQRFAYFMMNTSKRSELYLTTKDLYKLNKNHECPWCNKIIKGGNYFKHHGDNCKLNPNYIPNTIICEHCKIECDVPNYHRSHGDNCKLIKGPRIMNLSEEIRYQIGAGGRSLKGKPLSEDHKLNMRGPCINKRKLKPIVICDIISRKEFSANGWGTFLHFENKKHQIEKS